MRNKQVDRWKRRLLWGTLLAWLVISLVIGLGGRISGSLIPNWQEIFCALGLAPAPTTNPGELEVHFVDVGDGDCILIRQGSSATLIDAGERGDRTAVTAYLARQGVTRLDRVIATHGHSDHIGGMAGVLDAYPVGQLLVASMPGEDAQLEVAYRELLDTASALGTPIDIACPGDVYTIGLAQLQVIAPLAQYKEENDGSLVTRLTFGEHAFLFTGDAGMDAEEDMLYSGFALQADVLKIAHHGSDTASSTAFLRRVAPACAVIQCAAESPYGLPDAAVLQRLEREGIRCLRNDVHGHIVCMSDGHNLWVNTEKGG